MASSLSEVHIKSFFDHAREFDLDFLFCSLVQWPPSITDSVKMSGSSCNARIAGSCVLMLVAVIGGLLLPAQRAAGVESRAGRPAESGNDLAGCACPKAAGAVPAPSARPEAAATARELAGAGRSWQELARAGRRGQRQARKLARAALFSGTAGLLAQRQAVDTRWHGGNRGDRGDRVDLPVRTLSPSASLEGLKGLRDVVRFVFTSWEGVLLPLIT